jgi:hypothetical protein
MTGTTDIFLRINLLTTLDFLPERIPNLVTVPWLDICLEYQVDLFERPPHSLGIHEKHVYGHDEAENPKNDVRLPLDVVESGSYEVSQGEVENPVGSGRNTNTLSSVLQREDLGSIDPSSRSLILLTNEFLFWIV